MPYSTPTLSGSIPNPATQPLQGVLSWTQSSESVPNSAAFLCHCDGANHSTTFLDTSGTGNIITAGGTAAVDTASPEFGTGALLITTNTDKITTPCTGGGPLDLSTGDFTVEFWMRPAAVSGNQQMFEIGMGSSYASGGMYIYGPGGATPFAEILVSSGLVSGGAGGSPVLSNGTWSHIALCRQGGLFFLAANGVTNILNPAAPSLSAITWTGGTLKVGAGLWNISPANTQFDEIRVTAGTALYTCPNTAPYYGTYTVPTAPFPDGGGSVNATGYDIYRNGVSIVKVGAVLTYTDSVPTAGTYTYNVAAWSGSADESALSNTISLTYLQSIIGFPNTIFDEVIYGGYFGGQLNLVEFTYMPGRTPFEEGATNLIINRYKQEPTDSRQRGVDFTQFVVPGELLQTVAVTGINAQGVPQAQTNPLVTPLVITDMVIDPVTQLIFGYTASGGQNGIEYTVQFTTTTNIQTQTLEEIFSVNIMIEDMFP